MYPLSPELSMILAKDRQTELRRAARAHLASDGTLAPGRPALRRVTANIGSVVMRPAARPPSRAST